MFMFPREDSLVTGRMSWSVETASALLSSLPDHERLVLPALQSLQRAFGYIPDEALDLVADALNVSRAEVYGVFTFYHDLRSDPPPRTVVRLCVAEACQAQGSRELVSEVESAFGVRLGEPTSDVEIAEVFCLGNCALGPAAMIDGRLLGRCSVDRIRQAVATA